MNAFGRNIGVVLPSIQQIERKRILTVVMR